jgi:AcrR family transcriptional regulator
VPRATKPKPRRRLDSASARELILDATEKRLIVAGPSGIRLQEVAADAGVSHPTVLHHFGSREQLVQAVIARSLQAINATLVEAIGSSSGDGKQMEAMFESVARAFEKTGHGRVIMWLALEGQRIDGADVRLSDVVGATHALRLTRKKKGASATREDTARTVTLATLALVGGTVLGPMILESAGLTGPHAASDFRAWLARLLIAHFDE